MQRENRFRMVEGASDERRQRLEEAAQAEAERRFRLYQRLAEIGPEPRKEAPDASPKT
jgi:hypothetical protein